MSSSWLVTFGRVEDAVGLLVADVAALGLAVVLQGAGLAEIMPTPDNTKSVFMSSARLELHTSLVVSTLVVCVLYVCMYASRCIGVRSVAKEYQQKGKTEHPEEHHVLCFALFKQNDNPADLFRNKKAE